MRIELGNGIKYMDFQDMHGIIVVEALEQIKKIVITDNIIIENKLTGIKYGREEIEKVKLHTVRLFMKLNKVK